MTNGNVQKGRTGQGRNEANEENDHRSDFWGSGNEMRRSFKGSIDHKSIDEMQSNRNTINYSRNLSINQSINQSINCT